MKRRDVKRSLDCSITHEAKFNGWNCINMLWSWGGEIVYGYAKRLSLSAPHINRSVCLMVPKPLLSTTPSLSKLAVRSAMETIASSIVSSGGLTDKSPGRRRPWIGTTRFSEKISAHVVNGSLRLARHNAWLVVSLCRRTAPRMRSFQRASSWREIKKKKKKTDVATGSMYYWRTGRSPLAS